MFATDGDLVHQPVRASLVTCLATPAALDALVAPAGALALRVAGDEAIVMAPPGNEQTVVASMHRALSVSDPAALVLEITDAWAIWSLRQPQADAAIARLTSMPVPRPYPASCLAQGTVCGVAAKLVALPDRVCVMVNSTLGHHLRDRVLQLCADMRPRLQEDWAFTAPAAGAAGAGR